MKAVQKISWYPVVVIAFVIACSLSGFGQCYLSQGCKPVDNLNYIPNGNGGQVYHGDGASNDGTGGWTTYYADVNQCLACHYGTDTYPYLKTAHKNTLRKFAPGALWGGPDGINYVTGDPYYKSGSTYDWTNGTVTLGWCNSLATLAQNGLPVLDPSCRYPYYTLANSHAPAPYTTVPPTPGQGKRNLFYLFGGWENGGDGVGPVDTIFDQGFTGEIYPYGNFDCARCHATGYNFDNWGPEPTKNTSDQKVMWIPDTQLGRLPSDGYVAPGTSGTSSWYLSGIQCERCHIAAYGYGSHPWNKNVKPTIARYEKSTALCMECHRQEDIVLADSHSTPPKPGSISPSQKLKTFDKGYCSDLSGSAYSACVANPSNTWVYKPYFKYAQGQEFLNSPHGRFTGAVTQNAQNSADLTVTVGGTYDSFFSEDPTDPTKNKGCTGCHDPHQSTVAVAGASKPIVKTCDNCHALSQTILQTTGHPTGPGTPFPTGTQADIPGACITCHMQGALGNPTSHLWRIQTNSTYWTYPTPNQFYVQGISAPNTWTEASEYSGNGYDSAVWQDVDLACGQCHVGNDGKTNEYGLTMPPGMPGAHAFTRNELSGMAESMHNPDPGVPTPTFAPPPTTYTTPQTVTISDSLSGATIYYTTDGSVPTSSSPVYSSPITITSSTTFRAIATYAGMPRSKMALAQYTINLPTAPPPLFSPPPSTYSSPQSVRLSNTASLPMYYTTDGSTPTTSSTPYTVPISVTKNTTIKAITAAYGYLNSVVSTGNYYIQGPAPTFSPGSGSYSPPLTVTIKVTSGATIYYTTDGSTPTTSSPSCSSPCSVTLNKTTTIKAMAVSADYAQSTISVATYTMVTASPTFSPGAGTYYNPVTVTISDSTPAAVIYYSTTGLPSTSSPSCSSPCVLTFSVTTTLRAMAIAPGLSQSSTTVGVYTIQAQTPTLSPASGTYTSPLTVTISDATSGVSIYYTTDGSTPTTGLPACSNPCSVTLTGTGTKTVKAIAAAPGISQSTVGLATYTLK